MEDALKQKHWKDYKAAVGTSVAQAKTGSGRMTIDELLLNVKGTTFDSLVRQSDIQTEADKEALNAQGYDALLTEGEFREKFQIDPDCVWYSPSISSRYMYFNEETLAAAPLHLDMLLAGILPNPERFLEVLQSREEEVSAHDYAGSLSSLSDAMQMEYFNRLVEKKGAEIPGLYKLFFTNYINSDYGFSGIEPETLNAILQSKTEADQDKTKASLASLPDTVTIYRGGNTASTPFQEAFSWTLDINVANFFACRRGSGEGYIVEAEVPKEDIIDAFLDDRNEQEIFVHPDNVKVRKETPIHGIEFIEDVLPTVVPMYLQYEEQLMNLDFAQTSDEHGPEHEARVMLLSLVIAEHLDLPLRDRRALATAAIFHDTQRVNDIDDSVHGKAGSDYYRAVTANPDPIVEFLCEYHCRPDSEGYREIMNNRKLSKSRTRSKLLLDIFKDADGLERARFGIKAIDLNQIRLPISKELSLVARLFKEQVKVRSPQKQAHPSLSAQIQSAEKRKGSPGDSGTHKIETDRSR